ncbi:MAG TPA: hypothetical protein VHV08_00685, partial [Pirellulales bacterium]|nr:hypothetical protein [Pirellulales bacterium]
ASERVELPLKSPPVEQAPASDAAPTTDVELDHELPLLKRGLVPGNVIRLRAAATDSCLLGPQAGHSRWLSFHIVSSEELFYEILMRQREQRAKFSAATDSARTQSTALSTLAEPQEAVAIARAQQVIARQVWQVANQLQASYEEMTLNDLGNPQAREMLQIGIITPMRALHDDLLARLRAAIDPLGRQEKVSPEGRSAAEALSQEAVKAMEAILAQMAQWESFIDVVNQLKQIIERQGEVLKSTEEIKKTRTNSLFDE